MFLSADREDWNKHQGLYKNKQDRQRYLYLCFINKAWNLCGVGDM